MGRNWSNDERVLGFNGRVSRVRTLVIEALEAQGKEGATVDDICSLIGDDLDGKRPKGSIGQALTYMKTDGFVIDQGERWYLPENAPKTHLNGSNSSAAPAPATNGHKAQIAPFVGKRTGKTISLYTGHRTFSEVLSVHLLIGGRWFPVMLGDRMRIMVDFERPEWSPDQVTYSDVEVIKFTHKDGGVYEERPAPKDLVTIAPGE